MAIAPHKILQACCDVHCQANDCTRGGGGGGGGILQDQCFDSKSECFHNMIINKVMTNLHAGPCPALPATPRRTAACTPYPHTAAAAPLAPPSSPAAQNPGGQRTTLRVPSPLPSSARARAPGSFLSRRGGWRLQRGRACTCGPSWGLVGLLDCERGCFRSRSGSAPGAGPGAREAFLPALHPPAGFENIEVLLNVPRIWWNTPSRPRFLSNASWLPEYARP